MRNASLISVALLTLLACSMTLALADGGGDVGPCADTTAPTFGTDNTASTTTTGAFFPFNVNIKDDVWVENASVDYWYGSGSRSTSRLDLVAGDGTDGTYSIDVTIPIDSLASLNYIFWATDNSSNTNSTSVAFVIVSDDQKPLIDDYTGSVGSPTTGDAFSFWANVTDNIGIHQVRLAYTIGMPPYVDENLTMDLMVPTGNGTGTYVLNITIPGNGTGIVPYTVWAEDTAPNIIAIHRQVHIIDNDLPEPGADGSDTDGTTGDPVHLLIELGDNVGLGPVRLEYWFHPGQVSNVSMDPGAVKVNLMQDFHKNVTMPTNFVGTFWYRFVFSDAANNWNRTPDAQLPVADDDNPVVGPDGSHTMGEDTLVFEVNVTDNVGVARVWVEYTFAGELPVIKDMSPLIVDAWGNGTWGNVQVAVPLDEQVRIDYIIRAEDASHFRGQVTGSYVNQDLVPPVFGADGTIGEPVKGTTLAIYVEVTDNFGLRDVKLFYWYGEGAPRNLSMTDEGDRFNLTINLPRWPDGDLHYEFHAWDVKGNTNTTSNRTVALHNLPPAMATGLVWDVLEGKLEVLDLTPHLSDGNDQVFDLDIETDAVGVTVGGQRLNLYYETWMADHTITVNVSDGEDTVQGSIAVRVTNANDLPVITTSPPTEGKVTVAYEYQVEFSDEDVGDSHTFSFVLAPTGMDIDASGLVTWTPVAGQEGAHTVDLVLSDGTDDVHQYWTVAVTRRPSDQRPVFTNAPPASHTVGTKFTYDADAEDADGDDITFSLRSGPAGATVDADTGLLEWTPSATKRDTTEDIAFVISVTDDIFIVDLAFNVSLTYPEDAPPEILGGPETVVAKKDMSVDLSSFMSDPDDENADLHWEVYGDSKHYEARIKGNHLVVEPKKDRSGKGTVTLVLADQWGKNDTYELTIKVDTKKDDGPGFAALAAVGAMGALAVARRRRD